MGSGGNFASPLTVADGKVIPRGALDLGQGEQITRLEVWMTQQTGADAGAALTCTLDQAALRGSTTVWDGSGSNIDFEGDFVEGVATGTALAIVKVGNLVKTRTWTESVVLEPEGT
jgi:hypothetical protein